MAARLTRHDEERDDFSECVFADVPVTVKLVS